MNKKVLLGVIISIILLIGVGIVAYLNRPGKDFLTYKDPGLPEESQKVAQDRLNEAQKTVGEINDGTQDADKFERYVSLAVSYQTVGKLQEARDTYKEAINIKSDDPQVWHMYSALLVSAQDYDGALDAAKNAIKLDSGNSEYWQWRIAIEKDFFKASTSTLNDIYVQAIGQTKATDAANMTTSYARFLGDTGNLQSAKEYWQKAIELNPSNRATYEAEIQAINEQMAKKT